MNTPCEVMLATDYPVWFTLLFWVLAFYPIFPGFIMCVVAFSRGKTDTYMWASLTVLALGIGVLVWKYLRFRDGIFSFP